MAEQEIELAPDNAEVVIFAGEGKLTKMEVTVCGKKVESQRTTSMEALEVIPPIDLLVGERAATYGKSTGPKKEERNRLLEKWQARWDTAETGRWTHKLIKDLKILMDKERMGIDHSELVLKEQERDRMSSAFIVRNRKIMQNTSWYALDGGSNNTN